MRAANGWLYAWAHQYPAYRDLGSTLVAAVVRESQAVVANVGDSRAYLVRNGYPWLITRDHRWVAQEVAAGSLSWEQAQRHSWRKVLTQAIGTRPEVAVDVFQVALQPGDALVLCTDGLWERVRGQEIAAIVGRYPPGEAARHLATLARARGEQDDITALVVNWVATRPLAATYSPYPGYRQPAYAPTSAGLRTLAPGLARDGRLLAILLSLLAIYFVTALVILAAARGW